jgi:hypothetical protein
MIDITENVRNVLLQSAKRQKIYIEGSFLKIIKADDNDPEFKKYLDICREKDNINRRKRLDVTKQVQEQNRKLTEANETNANLVLELQSTLEQVEKSKLEAEKLRDAAVEDLEVIQKRRQFELIGIIVKVALFVIVGVGLLTTVMYAIALMSGVDTQIIGSTWSNMFGILLTNAFSIVGTIMGVNYATDKSEK